MNCQAASSRRACSACLRISLQFAQGGGIFFALAAQAAFLEAEIREIAARGAKDVRFDQGWADRLVLVREHASAFETAEGVDAGFERGNAQQTPFGVGERLDERALGIGGGRPLGLDAGDVGGVGGGVLGWQQDGAAGETGFQSVQG